MKKFITIILIVVIAGAILSWAMALSNKKDKEAKEKMTTSRVTALGDSLTYGLNDRPEGGYAGDLQKVLSKKHKGIVKVSNFGIPDQQTDGLLHQLKYGKARKSLSNADYIIMFIGTNDLIESNGGNLSEIHQAKIDQGKKDYLNNLDNIFKIIRDKNPDAPILFLGLYNPYPDSQKIQSVVDEWNDTSRSFTDKYPNVKFIATDGILKEKSAQYFSDSLHPNKKGYDLIAKRILKEYNFK
ncbi:GDSL-type esterase/lipase family protein [Falsibacillus pallidus]|uniref:Lysophospholipase L1-like esterase n=1 Tax=Falsibacillus pallidus TaxID=493781 RepID=A0A370GCR4_9BACI|nr:GDSL-type esterase/lipase family protein [Falsibacillus pallidus]RDI41010.1 lysophospholipase L1-like esterase [Falsibacillus pallidus]